MTVRGCPGRSRYRSQASTPARIQEALEQQVVADRIQVGNAQRVGHQRAGARAPPRPDRNAVVLAPVDEVLHDQEVAGKAHLDDGLALPAQAFVVLVALGVALGLVGEQELQALFQAFSTAGPGSRSASRRPAWGSSAGAACSSTRVRLQRRAISTVLASAEGTSAKRRAIPRN